MEAEEWTGMKIKVKEHKHLGCLQKFLYHWLFQP